jgi:hypothetical protein
MADPNELIDIDDEAEDDPAAVQDQSDPNGTPQPDVWRQSVADFYQLDVDASVFWLQIGPKPLIVDASQIYMGTGPDSGEVMDLLIDPSGASDKNIFIATDDGGVWNSIDGGLTWGPTTDQMLSLSMGAIAMDPANPQVLYAGTGNPFDSGNAFTKGVGVYRSTDGGLTWSIVDGGFFGTIFANATISKIVSPIPDCLLVATNKGLFRSVDGGRNFGANAPSFNDRKPVMAGNICCLFLDTATPAAVAYAGVAGNSLDAAGNPLPAASVGLFKSTNAGITFPTNLFSSPGAPALPYALFVAAQSTNDGAVANNAVLYVSVQNNTAVGAGPTVGAYVGFFRSIDSGAHWTPRPSLGGVAAVNGFKGTKFGAFTVGVDPLNSKRVYAGFQQLWLSIDGGNTFAGASITSSKVHWDNHAIAFSPAAHRPAAAPTTLYTGTDGGIASTADGGLHWKPLNSGIATNLFRGIDIGTGSAANNAYTYGGTQDTGTCGHRPTDNPGEWHAGINGDGWLVAVDPTDPKIVYGFDDQLFIKTINAGATWVTSRAPAAVGIGLTNPQPDTQRAIAIDKTGAVAATRVVYVSEGLKLYKSIDAGVHFAVTTLAPTAIANNYITCIVTTSALANLVWAGVADGTVHCSLDGGTTWDAAPFSTKPGGTVIPVGRVNHIAIDPQNTQRVAVVYGGFSMIHAKYRTRHVFLTLDGGATWSDVSGTDGNGPAGNLPDLRLRSVVFDKSAAPSAIVVAGDAGVLRSTDATITGTGDNAVGSATWKIYGAGLPTVCCNSLAIDNSVNPPVLRVGTYGRSCYEVTRPTGPFYSADVSLGFGFVPVGQSVTLPFYVYNCGNAALVISAITPVGTAPITLGANPAIPVTINPAATQAFQVTFAPTAAGNSFIAFKIDTNDPGVATYFISASGTGVTTGLAPRLATNPISTILFGTVTVGNNRTVPVDLLNVCTAILNIASINPTGGSGDVTLNPAPAFPIAILPGAKTNVTFQFSPSGAGPISTVFAVVSDDPSSPQSLKASGTGFLASVGFFKKILVFLGLAHLQNP